MLCQICNKNPATIHVQEIINGEKKVFHLCAECAAKNAETEPILQSFNLAEMLYNFTNENGQENAGGAEETSAAPSVKCAACGWDTERFRKTGRLGCPECYLVFSEVLSGVLENMHRGLTHLGKTPCNHETDHRTEDVIEKVALRRKIAACQQELEIRIRNEEYEEAAVLRDRIQELKRALEGVGKEKGNGE